MSWPQSCVARPWILLRGWDSQAKVVTVNITALLATLTTKEEWDILAPNTSSEHTGIMVLRARTTASGLAMVVGFFI